MKVAGENIFSETVTVRIRAKAQADIVSRNPVASDFILIALVKGKADRVFADVVLFKPAVVGRLKDKAVSPVTSIAYEAIAAHHHVFRKHDRGASGILSERIVFEDVRVRIHVVEPVTNVSDESVFDPRVVRE